MSPKSLSLEEQRARLESRANAIRSRLFKTMDALDNRRHQVTELGHQAKKLAGPVAASVLGLAVLAAGTAFAIGAAVERRRERNIGYRFARALAPLRQPPRPAFWAEAVRRMTIAAVGIAATQLLKRGARALDEAWLAHGAEQPAPRVSVAQLRSANPERPLLGE